MKSKLIAPLLSVFLAAPVLAEKPSWAGNGKPTQEQKEAHKQGMNAKESDLEELKLEKDKKDKVNGVEKQKEKKMNQAQNELDKGSEKGKETRKENSKKWWKFWGE